MKKLTSADNYFGDFQYVKEFEQKIADFFGAPKAVAVDSCTHGIELCLRLKEIQHIHCPVRTYLSVPMLAEKLNITRSWHTRYWEDKYQLSEGIFDAAVLWKRNSYIPGTMMNLSFQYRKHLKLGRGGMILLDNEDDWRKLKMMSYDGRDPRQPWQDQKIETLGYHYYMTPETAKLGLEKLPSVKDAPLTQWKYTDWPDISKLPVFDK